MRKLLVTVAIIAIIIFMINLFGNKSAKVGGKTAAEVFADEKIAQLAEAAAKGEADKVKEIAQAGVDVNAVGEGGVTPLLFAMGAKNEQGILALLDVGADPNLKNSDGEAPLHKVVLSSDWDGMKLLVERGADINIQTRQGETPFYLCITTGMVGNGVTECANYLLTKGAKADIATQNGATAASTLEDILVNSGIDHNSPTYQEYLRIKGVISGSK